MIRQRMNHRQISTRVLVAAIIAATAWTTCWNRNDAHAQQRFIATKMQDEPLRLPRDNTATLSASKRSFNIDLQYLADVNAPTEAMLTVVRPDNQRQDVEPDANGNFVVPNAVDGLYALFARTATGIATIPFYIKNSADAAADPFPNPDIPEPAGAVSDDDNTISVGLIANSRDSVERLADQYVYYKEPERIEPNRYEYQPQVRHGYQVRQGADGLVRGRIIIPTRNPQNRDLLANNNVFLVKNGVRIENVVSAEDGTFAFVNATPGFYGLVAAGPAGYTAFPFEVLPADAIAQKTADSIAEAGFVVTKAAVPVDELPVVMIPPEMAPAVIQIQREERDARLLPSVASNELPLSPAPFDSGVPGYTAGGGFGGGGSFGGGGGGGGLGGLGSAAALLAPLAVVAAASDDDGIQVPTPASPLVP